MKPTRRPSQFYARNRNVFMTAQSSHKWWSTLQSTVFGSSSSLPPFVGRGGGMVCESVDKADLLSDHFDGKQSRESVYLPLTCHPSPILTSFTFRSSEVIRLLLDLDSYWGSDPLKIKTQLSSIWAKGCMLMTVCVFYLT